VVVTSGYVTGKSGPGENQARELPVLAFESATSLRSWLIANHAESEGIWLKIFKKSSGVPSVTFEEVLDEGLCFGWSESLRRRGDDQYYLQRFTPRRTKGTSSERNRKHVERLVRENKMTPSGLLALETHKTTADQ
jgi:uncharacterized protein YdeI (YjbR/CyaY-like superfamily)